MGKILKQIFSVRNENDHKILTVLGIKFKFRSSKLFMRNTLIQLVNIHNSEKAEYFERLGYIEANYNEKFEEVKSYILASKVHKYLENYRGCYAGKDIVIVGCGPTLNYFEPIKNAVYMGINRAFKYDKIKYDYLFASDEFPEGMKEFADYEKNNCKKFLTYWWRENQYKIRTNSYCNIENYNSLVWNGTHNTRMPWDISKEPIGAYYYCSTSHIAIQFALYTLPRRIYIVGCDCSQINIYKDSPSLGPEGGYEYQKTGWDMIKEDIDYRYPEVEIVSINPVGLKGMFKDVYTQSYLNEHSELGNENIEIIGKEEKLCLNQ